MPEAERNLSDRLGLNWDVQMQDWDLNNANAEFIPLLIQTLKESTLSDDERYSLMALTLASVDDAHYPGADNEYDWASVAALLRLRPCLFASAIYYWAEPALQARPAERQFPISAHMAGLWNELLPDLAS